MKKYKSRIVDDMLKARLRRKGAVLIEGAKTLSTLAALIDTTKMKTPSFMMILTGVGRYAYRRPDGILVVPAGCLRN